MVKSSSKTMRLTAATAIKQQIQANSMRRSESFQSFSCCTTEESVADCVINDETSGCVTNGEDEIESINVNSIKQALGKLKQIQLAIKIAAIIITSYYLYLVL